MVLVELSMVLVELSVVFAELDMLFAETAVFLVKLGILVVLFGELVSHLLRRVLRSTQLDSEKVDFAAQCLLRLRVVHAQVAGDLECLRTTDGHSTPTTPLAENVAAKSTVVPSARSRETQPTRSTRIRARIGFPLIFWQHVVESRCRRRR